METSSSLSFLLTVPLLALLISWVIPKALQRLYAIFGSAMILALTVYETSGIIFSVSTEAAKAFFVDQRLEWVPELGLSAGFRLDGYSAWFLVLSALTTLVAFCVRGVWYRKQPRLFVSMGFFLLFALNSAFLATDLITFYLSYEAVFIPMIFMVGIWGENQKASSVFRFFLMSFAGSILMLVSIFWLMSLHHGATGQWSSHLSDILGSVSSAQSSDLVWPCAGFFLAFALKVPLVPFHGWLKEVYVNAPMPGTIWMSAILSKLGVAGIIRFVIPLFPAVLREYQGILLALSALSVVYAALLAVRSDQGKTLLAYSSISHLGFVMLGLFSLSQEGVNAAMLLSVGHAVTSGLLFFLLHQVEERTGDTSLNESKGLASSFPVLFTGIFLAVLASVSLPGTLNFGGEFLVLLNAYRASALCTILAGAGVVLGAVYMLRFFQRLGLGSPGSAGPVEAALKKDLSMTDILMVALLVGIVIYGGINPGIFMKG
jgi:NADH-quinone oxidoreductase subunit M